jgi:hypothetical protein
MIGNIQGDHTTDRGTTSYRGERLHNPERNTQFAPFGNEIAVRTTCGPGGSRTLYGQSGSQGQHGQAAAGNAPAKNRDILSEFGPDYKRS